MNRIKIITDSCSSIKIDFAKEHDIEIIPITFMLNGTVINPLEGNIKNEEFYQMLADKVEVKTASISPGMFKEVFEKYIKEGIDVLYVSLSSGLSGSYSNSLMGKELALDEFENAKIECIDSLQGGSSMAILILKAEQFIKEGKCLKDIKEELDQYVKKVESIFTIGSLHHLYKGGRISLTKATLGSILRAKPIIKANEEGKLENIETHIGKKKALASMCERVVNNIASNLIYLGYTNNEEEAKEVKERLLSLNSNLNIILEEIDFSLACHCGPETIAIFYEKKN